LNARFTYSLHLHIYNDITFLPKRPKSLEVKITHPAAAGPDIVNEVSWRFDGVLSRVTCSCKHRNNYRIM